MKYLLIMSLSGSTMVVIYMLSRGLWRGKMSARLQYLFIKAAMLYYLIPLPFVKKVVCEYCGASIAKTKKYYTGFGGMGGVYGSCE